MASITDIMSDVLALPRSDRSYLAAKIIESLEEDHELSPEWMEEIERRVSCRQSGETKSVSREDVHRDIERILA